MAAPIVLPLAPDALLLLRRQPTAPSAEPDAQTEVPETTGAEGSGGGGGEGGAETTDGDRGEATSAAGRRALADAARAAPLAGQCPDERGAPALQDKNQEERETGREAKRLSFSVLSLSLFSLSISLSFSRSLVPSSYL